MAKAKKVVDNGVVVSLETCVTSSSMVISLECVSPSAARDISLHNQRFTDVKVGFKTLPTSCLEQKPTGLFCCTISHPHARDSSQQFASTRRHDSSTRPSHRLDHHSILLPTQWGLRIPCFFPFLMKPRGGVEEMQQCT